MLCLILHTRITGACFNEISDETAYGCFAYFFLTRFSIVVTFLVAFLTVLVTVWSPVYDALDRCHLCYCYFHLDLKTFLKRFFPFGAAGCLAKQCFVDVDLIFSLFKKDILSMVTMLQFILCRQSNSV